MLKSYGGYTNNRLTNPKNNNTRSKNDKDTLLLTYKNQGL